MSFLRKETTMAFLGVLPAVSLTASVVSLRCTSNFLPFRWASSADDEEATRQAAHAAARIANEEKTTEQAPSISPSSLGDTRNPLEVLKDVSSPEKEDKRKEVERRSIHDAIWGHTGQVYGFDSRRVSSLLRAFFGDF